jgi:serine/threonine-protein kinase PknK
MSAEREVDLGISGITRAVEIGRGGFATVYRAFQSPFERPVAVKVFGGLVLDESTIMQFERECRAIGRIPSQPNILTVYEEGTSSFGQPYLVMPFLAQGSLADRLGREGRLPWAEAVRIGAKLAKALQAAHEAKVLHLDVKPENILVSNDGEPLLADFGVARLTDTTRRTRSPQGFSPAHVAPEVVAGQEPTEAADVYSLASTLFNLIVGRPPFVESDEDNFFLIVRRIESDPVPDLLRPLLVPEEVCRSIEAAMAKDPADRPVSAAVFGDELVTGYREAARREALCQEKLRQETARQEAARQEAARQEAARQEAARQEAARQDARHQEAARQRAARLEAGRREAARRGAEVKHRPVPSRSSANRVGNYCLQLGGLCVLVLVGFHFTHTTGFPIYATDVVGFCSGLVGVIAALKRR